MDLLCTGVHVSLATECSKNNSGRNTEAVRSPTKARPRSFELSNERTENNVQESTGLIQRNTLCAGKLSRHALHAYLLRSP